MKRYLIFGGDTYYPSGGWRDFLTSFDTLEESFAFAEGRRGNVLTWSQVVDSNTWEEIVLPWEVEK